MKKIFRKKEDNAIATELQNKEETENKTEIVMIKAEKGITVMEISKDQSAERGSSDMTGELMYLIGKAIQEWTVRYGLESLPKEMIFEQALAAMNAFYEVNTKKGE